jgi:hypothetical protein
VTGEARSIAAAPGVSPEGATVDDDDQPAMTDGPEPAPPSDPGPGDRRGAGAQRDGARATLLRWLTENRADTRLPGPPHGRRYVAPFAEVWDELRELIDEHPRWNLEHADETRGLMAATCRSRVFRFVDDLTVWVRLDADGLTEVALRSRSRTGRGDFGVNRRRIERILERLDGAFERV